MWSSSTEKRAQVRDGEAPSFNIDRAPATAEDIAKLGAAVSTINENVDNADTEPLIQGVTQIRKILSIGAIYN